MKNRQDGLLTTLVTKYNLNPNINSFSINITGTTGFMYKFKFRTTNIGLDFVDTNVL